MSHRDHLQHAKTSKQHWRAYFSVDGSKFIYLNIAFYIFSVAYIAFRTREGAANALFKFSPIYDVKAVEECMNSQVEVNRQRPFVTAVSLNEGRKGM